jgi:peptidoglycan/xylan/chitin deacetylase (PgdA/CDA1 family)
VLWELEDPEFSGVADYHLANGALQISNPSRVPNVGVPILMYHNVNPVAASVNWVTVCNFTEQVDYLADNGYTTIDGDDLYNYIYKGTPLPARPVWLVFDDAYQNVYDYAFPLMQARGLSGSIMTPSQYMGLMNSWDFCCERPNKHMSWNMLRSMSNAGFGAEGHTRHHAHLDQISRDEQWDEVWNNQRDLKAFLNRIGTSFAYPYGGFTEASTWLVAHSGFRSAVTTVLGKQYTDNANMYELSRIHIRSTDTLSDFISKLTAP